MSKTLLIIQREYLTRVKKKSFVLMTILGPLLIAGLMTGAVYLSIGLQEDQKILVVDDTTLFSDLKDGQDVTFYYSDEPVEDAKLKLKEGAYTAVLWVPKNAFDQSVYTEPGLKLFYKSQPGFIQLNYIRRVIEERTEFYRMKVNEIPPELFKRLTAEISLDLVKFTETGKEERDNEQRAAIGFIFAVLIYIFIFMYGVQVMKGVIEEKTNRIVEVIISSVKPFQLMLGKIVGVALVGLTQFLLWVILTSVLVSVASAVLLKDKYDTVEMVENVQMSKQMLNQVQQDEAKGKMDAETIMDVVNRINFPYFIGLFLFYFLGGYLLYSAMFAAIGAAVDNETETQQFMLPVTLPLIFGFIVAQLSMQNPDGPAAFWFSIIPFTSPVVMMVRIAVIPFETLAWQLALSMGLLILFFFAATWLAGRIYRTGILMYGKKVNYKELWRWLFYKG